MKTGMIASALAVGLLTGAQSSAQAEGQNMAEPGSTSNLRPCGVHKWMTMCVAAEVAKPDSGVDHVDALGYSGAAFRIHTLPREVICPSTVSPRFGYKPRTVEARTDDPLPALRQARMLAEPGQFGEYVSGKDAYELWISLLEAAEDSELYRAQEKAHTEDSGVATMNRYCFSSLVHAREAAEPFLKRRADELGGEPSRLVVAAADCYKQVAQVLKSVGEPAWQPTRRKTQAAAMRKAATLEAQAATFLAQALTRPADADRAQQTDAKEQRLDWVPPGKPQWYAGWINGYARGLQVIVNHLNASAELPPAGYDAVMGDLGAAFTMQADMNSLKRYDGHHDVGWWPMETLSFVRLDFLGRTLGREVREVVASPRETGEGAGDFYKKQFEPAIRSSVDEGKPCLAGFGDWWCIVTGYDTNTPCLFGMCTNQKQDEEKVDRVELVPPPAWLLVLGDTVTSTDRKQADRESLRFAVELHHDRALRSDGKERTAGWCTGSKAFQCWVEWLGDERRDQIARTHANCKGFLMRNRRTAIRYLRAMQQRHPTPVADHLEDAIRRYEEVIREADTLDTSAKGVSTPEGRAGMIAGIERIIGAEQQAVAALEKAEGAME